MEEVMHSDAFVVFLPDDGWKWEGWHGKVATSGAHPLTINGKSTLVESDITKLSDKLVGKMYKANGFEDTPGAVLSCEISVDSATLSKEMSVKGKKVAMLSTSGKFSVSMSPPAFKAASPPVADPMAGNRSGSWYFESPNQSVLNTD